MFILHDDHISVQLVHLNAVLTFLRSSFQATKDCV